MSSTLHSELPHADLDLAYDPNQESFDDLQKAGMGNELAMVMVDLGMLPADQRALVAQHVVECDSGAPKTGAEVALMQCAFEVNGLLLKQSWDAVHNRTKPAEATEAA